MGFWDVTKRMIQGKPAFEAPKSEDDWDDDSPTDAFADEKQEKPAAAVVDGTNLYDDKGYKQIPTATITNVRSDLSGNHIQLWATIKNLSDRDIMLDKITLLGTKFELDYPLSPGGQRMFRVFAGLQLTHDSYKKAELYYKDVLSGDYFRADHMVRYTYEADKTYEVVGFDLISPIVDV